MSPMGLQVDAQTQGADDRMRLQRAHAQHSPNLCTSAGPENLIPPRELPEASHAESRRQ